MGQFKTLKIKMITCLILIITVFNFVAPNYVQANIWDDAGGALFEPIFKFARFLGDSALSFMQKAFLGDGNLETNALTGTNNDTKEYQIKYSPGKIFSGEVPMLDINFIKPNMDEVKVTTIPEYIDKGTIDINSSDFINTYGFDSNTAEVYIYNENDITVREALSNENTYVMFKWKYNNKNYAIVTHGEGFWENAAENTINGIIGAATVSTVSAAMAAGSAGAAIGSAIPVAGTAVGFVAAFTIGFVGTMIYNAFAPSSEWTLWEQDSKTTYLIKDSIIASERITTTDPTDPNIKTIKSVTSQLTDKIATWYKGLRIFSLVGLLSILLYIGIRIIISSVSEDKAKYKKMLMNWIAAICIVFILHYTMLFIVNLSEQLVSMLKSNAITQQTTEEVLNGVDIAFSSIRNKIETYQNQESFTQLLGQTIVYLTLVIYTGVFSFQYLKRVVYVAFLTLMAPLIALTYPLDKIKDGKAQAFSMWLKEYIFNCLLQPVHLLLYNIFIGGFADSNFLIDNPLYALVAVGFLISAEKFFRKMFGMESQTSVGTIGAAAGGAMVMGMLSKLKGKPSKEEGAQQVKYRTANQNSSNTMTMTRSSFNSRGGSKTNSGTGTVTNSSTGEAQSSAKNPNSDSDSGSHTGEASNIKAASETDTNTTTPDTGSNTGTGYDSGSTYKFSMNPALSPGSQVVPVWGQRFMRGAGNVLKTHFGTKDAWKRHGKRAGKSIVRAVGGVLGLTISSAAGLSTGSAENVIKYGATGTVLGAHAADNAMDKVVTGASHIKADYQKGAMGIEAYNNMQFDKQFWANDESKILLEKYKSKFGGTKAAKKQIQGFLDRGITDTKQMDKMIKNNITPDKYSIYKSNGINDVEKMVELEKEKISPEEYSAFANEGITQIYKMKKAKEYAKKYNQRTGSSLTSEQLAKRMAVVNTIPKEARNNKRKFKNHIRTRLHLNWNDAEIDEFYNEYYNL